MTWRLALGGATILTGLLLVYLARVQELPGGVPADVVREAACEG